MKKTPSPRYECFNQTAFTKVWGGCPEVGIILSQRFYTIHDAKAGSTIELRRGLRAGSQTELSLDGGMTWRLLPRDSRSI
mgnify:FL=1